MKFAIDKKSVVWSQLAVFITWAAVSVSLNAGGAIKAVAAYHFSAEPLSFQMPRFCIEADAESQDESAVFDGLQAGPGPSDSLRLLQRQRVEKCAETQVHRNLVALCAAKGRAPPRFS